LTQYFLENLETLDQLRRSKLFGYFRFYFC